MPERRRRFASFLTEMLQTRDKPLLFMDIDGVISLFGFASDRRPAGRWTNVDGTLHLLSAEAAEHLRALAGTFDVVWASGWEEKAEEHLPHLLAVPSRLPYLTFSADPGASTPGHWKLEAIDTYAANRALAWVDDSLNEACRVWAARRRAATLLVDTDPATGLTAEHAQRLTAWATSLRR